MTRIADLGLMQPMPYSRECVAGRHRDCTGDAGTLTVAGRTYQVGCACGCHGEPEAVAA